MSSDVPSGSDTVFKFMALRAPEKHAKIKSVTINPAVLGASVYFKAISGAVTRNKSERLKLVPRYSSLRESLIDKMLNKESINDSMVDEQEKSFEKVVERETGTIEEIRKSSQNLIESRGFSSAADGLQNYASFGSWLESALKDQVSLEILENKIREIFGQSSAALVRDRGFLSAKVSAAEGIVALHFTSFDDADMEDKLLLAMRAISLIERVAKKDKSLEDAVELAQSLEAVVSLSPDFFDKPESVPQPIRRLSQDHPRMKARTLALQLKETENARRELGAVKVEDMVLKNARTPSNAARKTRAKEGAFSLFLAPTAVARLSKETTRVLGNLSIAAKETELAGLESALEVQARTISTQLYSLPEVDASETIDDIIAYPTVDIPTDVQLLLKVNAMPASPQMPHVGPAVFADPSSSQKKEGFIAGISDLMVVKQRIMEYAPGEIAHVENVLVGEFKERTHRTLDRKEEVVVIETETTEEKQRELATTDRFELQRAAEETMKEDSSLKTGVDLTVRYGKVFEGNWNLGYEKNKSKQESNKESSSRTKEVMEKSIEKITSKVVEKRSVTTIHEVEETNKHGIDNKGAENHVRGVYQWLDKRYCVELVNYGKRLMLDFILPEPSKFLNYAIKKILTSPDFNLVKPEKPYNKNAGRDLRPSDITPANYLAWASKYRVSVNPPPRETSYQSHVFVEPVSDGKDHHFHNAAQVQLLEGYNLDKVWVGIGRSSTKTATANQIVEVGVANCPVFGTVTNLFSYDTKSNSISDQIPVSVSALNVAGYSATIMLRLKRTDSILQKWQIETYQKIIEGYLKLKVEYDEKLAEFKRQQKTAELEGKSTLGLHPDRNRIIEREELKKLCVMMMIKNHLGGKRAMSLVSPQGYPEFDFSLAEEQGTQIQFFEHAIEWEQMMYIFYPYFWGAKSEWDEEVLLEEQDPQFEQFRKAGAARVVVPVHPNFEEVFLHFTKTGKIWKGASKPQVDDPLYLSIVEEIRSQQGAIEGGEVVDRWEFKVPTSLVYLRENDDLPIWPPCEAQP